jgi:hypothetical protein
MRSVASRKGLHSCWPGEKLTSELTKKAEGLFIWVDIVSRYLYGARDPGGKLVSFISKGYLSGLPAEEKMDELYSAILAACDWSDKDFAEGYHVFIGAIMAAKTPLSMSALRSLHGNIARPQVKETLGPLASLLTGVVDQKKHVHILHVSLREFLTDRARHPPTRKRFHLNEREHSQRLALLCIRTLNDDLPQDIPCRGHPGEFEDYTQCIPEIAESYVAEELWYACEFWIDHIVEVEAPTSDLLHALRNFLSERLVACVVVVVSKGRFQGLRRIREWLQVNI